MRKLPPALAALLTLCLLGPSAAAASPVDSALASELAGAPVGTALRVEVLLAGNEGLPAPGAARQQQVGAIQDSVLAILPAGEWTLIHRYQSIAGLSGRATAAAVAALAAHPDVLRVSLDGLVFAKLAQGRALIGANIVHSQGLTGAGIKVAVLDTGVDSDHPDLADDLIDQVCFCSSGLGCCPNGEQSDTSAEDDQGHGTSVSGIVTSSGAQAAVGVAPDANLIGAKVLDSSGSGNFSDTAAALDWLLTNHSGGAPLVVNLSLGDGDQYTNSTQGSCDNSTTASAIAALHAAGVSVIVASGNEGHDAGISFPACVAQAISVGGVYDADMGSITWCGDVPVPVCDPFVFACTDDSAPDGFVCHSNSGPILDVLAPDYQTRTSAMGGGVETDFGGTSAASPYTAGQVALLLQEEPTLTPEQIRALLVNHGPLVTNPDNGESYPRTDIAAAVASLPEPAAGAQLCVGIGSLLALARRRRRRA